MSNLSFVKLDIRSKGSLREVYGYTILTTLLEAPDRKFTANSIAIALSIPFTTTFYRACELLVGSGLIESEGAKATKKYWLPARFHQIAERECWRWANTEGVK